ncbi:GTPase IMAP family member 8-like [Desmodus rotundus]|uniref:GTPase IMAP family member 8-like n=1 Tax=Desmodus rotundus TaxID=9430 RepID=UPI0039E6B4FD
MYKPVRLDCGAGKSAAGHSLLGKRVFETKFHDHSVTKKFEPESRVWREKKILIMESPHLTIFEGLLREEEALNTVLLGRSGAGKGATGTAILPRSDFSLGSEASQSPGCARKARAYRQFSAVCPAMKDIILVLGFQWEWFVHKDKKVVVMLESIPERMLYGRQVYAYNNKTGQAREDQVTAVLKMASELIHNHKGHGYSCAWENVSKITKDAEEKQNPIKLLKNLEDRLS